MNWNVSVDQFARAWLCPDGGAQLRVYSPRYRGFLKRYWIILELPDKRVRVLRRHLRAFLIEDLTLRGARLAPLALKVHLVSNAIHGKSTANLLELMLSLRRRSRRIVQCLGLNLSWYIQVEAKARRSALVFVDPETGSVTGEDDSAQLRDPLLLEWTAKSGLCWRAGSDALGEWNRLLDDVVYGIQDVEDTLEPLIARISNEFLDLNSGSPVLVPHGDQLDGAMFEIEDQRFVAMAVPRRDQLATYCALLLQEKPALIVRLSADTHCVQAREEQIGPWTLQKRPVAYCEGALLRWEVTVKGPGGSHSMSEIEYAGWMQGLAPDRDDFSELFYGYHALLKLAPSSGPIVVMSEHGCGRVGTFIMCHALGQLARRDQIPQLLTFLRKCRPGLLASVEQYVFVHQIYFDMQTARGRS